MHSFGTDVRQITSNTPALETLILSSSALADKGFSLEETIKLCRPLKKLKYLHMRIIFKVSKKHLIPLLLLVFF
jgi:ADP-heptose:LPS heptosyltransferase